MSNELIIAYTTRDFRDFAVETPSGPGEFLSDPTCLADFLQAWLFCGKGVRACNGSFETFTIAVIGIIEAWLKDPGMTDFVPEEGQGPIIPRRVTSIFGSLGAGHRALDPYFFARCSQGYFTLGLSNAERAAHVVNPGK